MAGTKPGRRQPSQGALRRRRRPLRRGRLLFFTLTTLLGFVLLLELGLQLGAWLQPPQTHIQSDEDIPEPLEDSYRILAVGDSWVFGAEAEPEEAFVQVLARGIEEETGVPVQVYNFGESASNSSQALMDVAEWTPILKPDLVIALTGANNMLHDTDRERAAAILGEDPRVLPGFALFGQLRTVRLLRQIIVTQQLRRSATKVPGVAAAPNIPDLLQGVGGTDPTGGTGLPAPPADHVSAVVELEWWLLFVRRDWDNGLIWVRASEPRSDSASDRGFMKAWEAIFLAHTEDFEAAERIAREALELGGDDSVAWEALAVAAERQDKPLLALQHRIRAADAAGFPWIRDRARALALLELEAWEAAEDWLMWCQAAVPANLEILLGLSRLPATTRAPAVEEVLANGPRGRVTPIEYYRWHEISSGIVDRMIDSLGEEDKDEPAAMAIARGRAAAMLEDRATAEASYSRAATHSEARTIDRDRAEAGLIALARDATEFRSLVGRDAAATAVTASNAPALISWYNKAGQCEEVIRVGQLALALGIAPRSFEKAATGCLSREVGWSLAEQALARGPVLDRAALVLGQPAGSIPGPITKPDVPFWDAFEERRFAEVATFATPDWRGLALAHLGQTEAARDALALAKEQGGDQAVVSYAHSLLLQQEGNFTESTLAALQAAEVDGGSPWVRAVAEGIALTRVLKWNEAQPQLLAALRVLPGYLEALEALSEVPQPLRVPGAEIALRYVPSGRVPAPRWADWYRAQDRFTEARLALSWPEGVLPMDPRSRALRALALGHIEADERNDEAARAAYHEAMSLAEALESKTLFCQAAGRAALVSGEEVDDVELVVLEAVCNDSPDSLDAIGRIAALRGQCKRVHDYAHKALDAGADPADISGWMEPCSPAEYVDKWIPKKVRSIHHLPANAASLLAHRVHPGEEDELPTLDKNSDEQSVLVRQLSAMAKLADSDGARFVALTYPFPGAHHRRVRDTILSSAEKARIPTLDLYGHFESTYSESEWQSMRTPEDHVNSEGYAEIGRELLRYLKLRGALPQPAP